MFSLTHPLWLVGFRPFFSIACITGAALPVIWVMMLTGTLSLPGGSANLLGPLQWHAHEMFYGFGWAVLGGFLLTSTKNWVGIRGYHGPVLVLLATAWLCERAAIWYANTLPKTLFVIGANFFLVSIIVLLLYTLIAHRQNDSYSVDNRFFLVALPLFLIAKNLLLLPDTFAIGASMSLGLFRVAFLVMLERTLTQFMKGVFQTNILRAPLLDNTIKLLVLVMVLESLLPPLIAGIIALITSMLLLCRFAFWKPHLALRRIDIGVMYLGYLAIAAQLLLDGAARFIDLHWVGTLPTHIFTFGAMGLIIPAMIMRISKGHTGRKVVFTALDRTVLWMMIAAFSLRIVMPQVFPERYTVWIHSAATVWCLAFIIVGVQYIPWLFAPRVDGKEH